MYVLFHTRKNVYYYIISSFFSNILQRYFLLFHSCRIRIRNKRFRILQTFRILPDPDSQHCFLEILGIVVLNGPHLKLRQLLPGRTVPLFISSWSAGLLLLLLVTTPVVICGVREGCLETRLCVTLINYILPSYSGNPIFNCQAQDQRYPILST